jgi:hypothetical protein
MYAVTTLQGGLVALAVSATVTGLVLGVLRFFPRARQTISTGVECSLIRRRATAALERDEWTRCFTDVSSCSVLGSGSGTLCRRSCLLAVARSPRATRS